LVFIYLLVFIYFNRLKVDPISDGVVQSSISRDGSGTLGGLGGAKGDSLRVGYDYRNIGRTCGCSNIQCDLTELGLSHSSVCEVNVRHRTIISEQEECVQFGSIEVNNQSSSAVL
jgi:hypothetical protein